MNVATSDLLRDRLAEAQSVVGTFIKLPSVEVIELAAIAGFDFVAIDLEHSQLDERAARSLIHHGAAMGFPVVARIPSAEPAMVNRLLEAGAAGIQLSNVASRSETEQLIASARYSPRGNRSISLAQPSAGYGSRPMQQYLRENDPGPLLIGQIEQGVLPEPLTEILKGLDVTFVGFSDLSLSLGRPGTMDEIVISKIEEIAEASREVGTVFGGWLPSPDGVSEMRRLGAQYYLVGADLQFLKGALANGTEQFRAALEG